MRFYPKQVTQLQERIKSIYFKKVTNLLKLSLSSGWKERMAAATSREITDTKSQLLDFHDSIKVIGAAEAMDDFEKRKLGIFNLLNFFQLITGIGVPLVGLFHNRKFSEGAWLVACLPAVISVVVLWLNANYKFETGKIVYFICYPVATCFVYMNGIHMGLELFFILYGILSVFFIQEISQMLFSVSLNMVSYFMLAVIWTDRQFLPDASNSVLYLFNQFAAIVFIFYGLFLIKRENFGYQASILLKNREIAENAVLMEQQTAKLTELNQVKNKLFSVIAHDLKTPMYGMRNIFRSMQQAETPPKKIKAMLPDMINNLNYTTGLMENLLQWAKFQMQSDQVKMQTLDITKIIGEAGRLLQVSAEAKQVSIGINAGIPVLIHADKDIIELVMRNLLSNAIKFTPEKGTVTVGVLVTADGAEIFVADNGRGISPDALQKINNKDYYSTNGTAQEPGTGLGLMLCREFLEKNGSQLIINSALGKGSRFSFSFPVYRLP